MVKKSAKHSSSQARHSSGKEPAALPTRASRAELYVTGQRLRDKSPRGSHAEWKPSRNRIDPLSLINESNNGRLEELVPIRHGRMLKSPFTFYRGAALNMAADLARTPQ